MLHLKTFVRREGKVWGIVLLILIAYVLGGMDTNCWSHWEELLFRGGR